MDNNNELITATVNRDFSGAGQWVAQEDSGSDVSATVTSNQLRCVTTTDSEHQGVRLPNANLGKLEPYETYYITADITSDNADAQVFCRMGTSPSGGVWGRTFGLNDTDNRSSHDTTTTKTTYEWEITLEEAINGNLYFLIGKGYSVTTREAAYTVDFDNISIRSKTGGMKQQEFTLPSADVHSTAVSFNNILSAQVFVFSGTYADGDAGKLDKNFELDSIDFIYRRKNIK